MQFPCPRCATTDGLRAVRRMALPSDARSDEIRVEIVVCAACGADGAVVVEASRRGALDAESVARGPVALAPEALDALDDAIAACPAPLDERCACAAHHHLGRTDPRGRWVGLAAAADGLRDAVLAPRVGPGLAVPERDAVPGGGGADGGVPAGGTDAALAAALATPVGWSAVADVVRPWAAEVGGARWRLLLGDFPDEALWTLEIDGTVVGAFDDWPPAWTRP